MRTIKEYLLPMLYAVAITWAFVFACRADAKTVSRDTIKKTIVETSVRYGVDPQLALAIAERESNLNPDAVGSIGELGVFQLRPEYHKVRRGDYAHNIDVAIRYLAKLKQSCSHYGEAYFVCYNVGPNYKRLKYPHLFPYYKHVTKIMVRNSQYLVANSD
jgi:soluble lytic murein transglycosylase-like protein